MFFFVKSLLIYCFLQIFPYSELNWRKWETLIFLDHVEPYENLKLNNKSKYERPLTPIETIYIFKKSNLVILPVIKTLIVNNLIA